jgi:hypothetical protein
MPIFPNFSFANVLIEPREYTRIGGFLISIFFGTLFFYPYIQTEVYSTFNQNEFDNVRFCKSEQENDFKKLKIINLEKNKNNAKIYCLYNQSSKNYSLNLFLLEGNWRVETSKSLNDGFFWPIYY